MSRTGCVLRNANCCPTERYSYVHTIHYKQCELWESEHLLKQRGLSEVMDEARPLIKETQESVPLWYYIFAAI
jgi:hypothetical protein